MITPLTVVGPKSHNKDGENGEGFITGQGIYTVTDSLIIRPVSPILGLSILNELKVPFKDIEEQTVHVGKEEVSFSYANLINLVLKGNCIFPS